MKDAKQDRATKEGACGKTLVASLVLCALIFGVAVVLAVDEDDVAELRQAAQQGNASAQYALGIAYATGKGVPQEDAQALVWYRRAAEQGHEKAQHNLGLMYQNGEGTLKNNAEALIWYRRAANQGLASAQNNLGLMYKNGHGVPKDFAEAVAWYRRDTRSAR